MARFVPAPDLPRQVLKESTKGRSGVARLAAAHARATAPVVTGAYRDGIGVRVNQGTGEVNVVDDDPLATIKEYGTVDTPAHMTLTNAVRRYGRVVGSVVFTGSGPLGMHARRIR